MVTRQYINILFLLFSMCYFLLKITVFCNMTQCGLEVCRRIRGNFGYIFRTVVVSTVMSVEHYQPGHTVCLNVL
jgi:hypothetical protein